MDTREILAVIDAEIERLQRVRELLSDKPARPGRGRPATGTRGKAT